MKATTLIEKHQDHIRRWINSGHRDGLMCAARDCSGKLMAPTVLISDDEGALSIVPLSCNRCGRVAFFDAKIIGLEI